MLEPRLGRRFGEPRRTRDTLLATDTLSLSSALRGRVVRRDCTDVDRRPVRETTETSSESLPTRELAELRRLMRLDSGLVASTGLSSRVSDFFCGPLWGERLYDDDSGCVVRFPRRTLPGL